jgi:hypothetical protein
VEFWKQIYDIDISPEEIPLLKIKMVNSENTFTYPPSMCFFAGGDSLVIPAGVQGFIENKKSSIKTRMDEVASKTIQDLRIGTTSLGSEATIKFCGCIRTMKGDISEGLCCMDCIWTKFPRYV